MANIRELKNTKKLAEIIAKNAKASMVIALRGGLGAGKTTLTKFICEYLNVDEFVTSPTFTIINVYEGDFTVYHMDAYRLEDTQADYLGLDDYFYSDGITIVEWPQIIESELPEEYILIDIDENREIKIEVHGSGYASLKEEIYENLGD